MEKKIETLTYELETSGKRIIDLLCWVKNTTRQIDEQFKNNPVGNEMNISFNSLGEFQGKCHEVDMEIARFTSLQKTLKMLEN